MEYKRKQFDVVMERVLEPRLHIQVLTGPRQVGKSTLIDQVFSEIDMPYYLHNADAVDPNDSDWISRTWQAARNAMSLSQRKEALLVIA